MRILIVEDEKELNRILSMRLRDENYITDSCYSGRDALNYLSLAHYDCVILDLMLPEMDGLTVLKNIRGNDNEVPILILSARSDTTDIVKGLDSGADDYMIKPFDFRELLARLRLIMRKKVETRKSIYRCCDLVVDTSCAKVTRAGNEITLSRREFAILLYLIRHRNMVVSRRQIVDNIYSIDQEVNSNVIDVYIRLLRKKIDSGHEVKLIHTIYGMGYQLKCEE